MKNTLFVDWRGKAFICDHDIHGEHTLGDLMTDSLESALERRQKLLDEGLSFRICKECNDIMRIGHSPVLESGSGGIFRDWIYDLYKESADPLSNATLAFKWIYKIYEKENRLDRLVNRLLEMDAELAKVRRSRIWRILNTVKRVNKRVDRLVHHA